MPKQDTNQGKKLAALLKRLGTTYNPEEPAPRDPVLQLVVAFLQWEATRKQAEEALGRIMEHMVDVNDLRVSFEAEILDLLGDDYPLAEERIARMREALNAIYVREYDIQRGSIAEKGKKDQRAYLDSLPGVPPYVAAQVMLLSFGGHAMPVDEKLIERLADEEVLDAEDEPQHAENVLLRLVRAEESLQTHLLLQSWADERAARRRAASKRSTGKKPAASRSRTTRRKTTGRTTKTATGSRKK